MMGQLAREDYYPTDEDVERLRNPPMPQVPRISPWEAGVFRAGSSLRDQATQRPELAPQMGSLLSVGSAGETARDVGLAAPSGAARGLMNAAIMVGAPSNDELNELGLAGTEEARKQIEAALYKPQTLPGKFTGSVFEVGANPINYIGPGTLPIKAAWNVASGVTGETAAQAAEGTGYEKAARLVGSFGPAAAERAWYLTGPAVRSLPEGTLGMAGGKMTVPTEKRAPFPEYAEAYPAAGPPLPTFDKEKGAWYDAKQLTPEAKQFEKARKGIIADMKKNGYEPFFNVAERYHVDPTNYPPNVDTLTITPAKQATIDKYMREVGSPEARARLQVAYKRGTEMPNTADWYAMGQLEKEFINELGPEAGRKAFQDKIATSMAATTGGADPTSNWLMAHYGNYLRERGLPYPEFSHQYPFPIGGRYAANNMAMHQKAFDQGGFDYFGAANPKRHNFAQNFTGNRRAATMDEQMTELMTPGRQIPPDNTYGLYERVLGEEAQKAGVLPQNFQDVAWSGAKNLKDPKKYTTGQPFIQTINESIERTHRLTGMPKSEILRRGIIRSEIPMYGVGGMGVMGALANQATYESPQ